MKFIASFRDRAFEMDDRALIFYLDDTWRSVVNIRSRLGKAKGEAWQLTDVLRRLAESSLIEAKKQVIPVPKFRKNINVVFHLELYRRRQPQS